MDGFPTKHDQKSVGHWYHNFEPNPSMFVLTSGGWSFLHALACDRQLLHALKNHLTRGLRFFIAGLKTMAVAVDLESKIMLCSQH